MTSASALMELAGYAVLQPGSALSTRLIWAAGVLLVAASAVALDLDSHLAVPAAAVASPSLPAAIPETSAPPAVWLIESRAGVETYSNGLRIDDDFRVQAPSRQYRSLRRGSLELSEVRSYPAGIVYHTTESHTVPFEAPLRDSLRRDSLATLAYVQQNGLYHFVIDRFGLVHRVVEETAAARHAGFSIWADELNVYLNLNQSFIGVSFEGQTGTTPDGYANNPAQLFAARVLTEMLRSKYGIPEGNCVTHAQVSVNPSNRRIGYHTDWAKNFPFRELGLRAGYETALPSIAVFGFDFDANFLGTLGADRWAGLAVAENQLASAAAGADMNVTDYRKTLQRRYRQATAELGNGSQ